MADNSEVFMISGIRGSASLDQHLKAGYLWQAPLGSEIYVVPGYPVALLLDNYIEQALPNVPISGAVTIRLKRMRRTEDNQKQLELVRFVVNQADLYCRPFLEYREIEPR